MSRFVFRFSTRDDHSQKGLIPVNIKVHAEARTFEEEWSGKTSRTDRRKLQNRLNQRSYRRRKAEEKQIFQQVYALSSPNFEQHGEEPTNQHLSSSRSQYLTSKSPSASLPSFEVSPDQPGVESGHSSAPHDDQQPVEVPILAPASWCRELEDSLANLGLVDGLDRVADDGAHAKASTPVQLEEAFLAHPDARDIFPLAADHLLSLMYYNVFRALVRNVESLSLDMELMHSNSYPSPFISNTVNSIEDLSTIPSHFHPTIIQQTIPHHPCFDIFPDPALRDNGILHCAELPHGKLCLTLAGRETWYERDLLKRNGMVIWADPDKVESWEVTEGFARNWPWLVKGAWRLENSTNAWRRLRGEGAVSFA